MHACLETFLNCWDTCNPFPQSHPTKNLLTHNIKGQFQETQHSLKPSLCPPYVTPLFRMEGICLKLMFPSTSTVLIPLPPTPLSFLAWVFAEPHHRLPTAHQPTQVQWLLIKEGIQQKPFGFSTRIRLHIKLTSSVNVLELSIFSEHMPVDAFPLVSIILLFSPQHHYSCW